jgi:outer membrane protein assembly factor BamB
MISIEHPARLWAVVGLMLAALVPMADSAAGSNRCLEDFAPVEEGTARPTSEAERVLTQARSFAGDRYLGRLRWATAHPTKDRIYLGPAKDGLVAVSGGWLGTRVMRASDGTTVWERTGTALPGDAGGPGTIVLNSSDHLAAFDMATGRNLWCAPRSGRFPEGLDNETLVTEHGDVLDIGTSITSLHARTGKPRWRLEAQPTTIETGAGVVAYASLRGPGGLQVRQLPDARLLWRHPSGSNERVSQILGVRADRVLVDQGGDGYSWTAAYDLGTGERRWRRMVLGNLLTWRLLDDRLLINDSDFDERIHALRISDGSPLWSVDVPGGLNTRYAPLYRDRLYGADRRGGLKVFDTKRGTVSRTLTGVAWPTPDSPTDSVATEYGLTIGDGLLLAQAHNLTLAFDLPR